MQDPAKQAIPPTDSDFQKESPQDEADGEPSTSQGWVCAILNTRFAQDKRRGPIQRSQNSGYKLARRAMLKIAPTVKPFLNKYVAGVMLLTAVGIVRIVSTYSVFNGTYDEPAHIACGMEWLQWRSEEHTSELQSRRDLVCRLLLEKKN